MSRENKSLNQKSEVPAVTKVQSVSGSRAVAKTGMLQNRMPTLYQSPSIFELMFLPPPEREFSLEALLPPTDATGQLSPAMFETVNACMTEDKRRAQAFRAASLEDLLEKCSSKIMVNLDEWLDSCSSEADW